MRVHEKNACGTDTQLPKQTNDGAFAHIFMTIYVVTDACDIGTAVIDLAADLGETASLMAYVAI